MKITIELIHDSKLEMDKLNVTVNETSSPFVVIGMLQIAILDLHKQVREQGNEIANEFLLNAIGREIEPHKE